MFLGVWVLGSISGWQPCLWQQCWYFQASQGAPDSLRCQLGHGAVGRNSADRWISCAALDRLHWLMAALAALLHLGDVSWFLRLRRFLLPLILSHLPVVICNSDGVFLRYLGVHLIVGDARWGVVQVVGTLPDRWVSRLVWVIGSRYVIVQGCQAWWLIGHSVMRHQASRAELLQTVGPVGHIMPAW